MTDDVYFEVRGRLGLITLNRPRALNALTAEMCVRIRDQLQAWDSDERIISVAVLGAGDKAFCAGGDVVKVTRSYREGTREWQEFFLNEYRMNVAINAFSKPYVALVDGITMGGGVGVSIPGDYWVATEKTLFAMPETGLGLFPDVGGGWFLPRLPGAAGLYLGLTGTRLKAPDLFALGLASHVISTDTVDEVIAALSHADRPDDVGKILDARHTDPDPAPIARVLPLIDDCFDARGVDEVLANLKASGEDWCAQQVDILESKSPTSLKVTAAQIDRGRAMPSFQDNMNMEYRIVNHIMTGHDFFEGVRAILVDKDQAPKWSPGSLDAVSDDAVEAHFKPLGTGHELLDLLD